jgi:two-component system LytT family response regulator
MITCIIVDDEANNQDALKKMLDLYVPSVELLGVAANITEAKALIDNKKPQMVFLDVEMPGGSGFDLLEMIKETEIQVVFTTAHAAYAIKAIKYAAMDYLLKPINLIELKSAVEKSIANKGKRLHTKERIDVLQNNRSNNKFSFNKIALRTADGIEFLNTSDIIRCEADRANCKFHIADGRSIVVSSPMTEYEDILIQSSFIKVHKSNIVNLRHVSKYMKGEDNYLIMSDNSQVNVALRREDELVKILGKG